MYRLTIYGLAGLVMLAMILSALGILPYNALFIAFAGAYLSILSWGSNLLLAKLFKTKANAESAFITALILTLLAGPLDPTNNLLFLSFLAVAAMASKYLLAWRGRHLFNPAAFAVVASAIILGQGASWWVGSAELAPAVALLGIALIYKMGRGAMVGSFLFGYFTLFLLFNIDTFGSITQFLNFAWIQLLYTPILFFAFIMLTEPQTSPRRTKQRILYGIGTAAAVIAYQQYLPVGYTLELALLTGNILAYSISRSFRITLALKEKQQLAPRIYSFRFAPSRPIQFLPGQFLEWTLPHKGADSRGIRRYFTIASAPSEHDLLLTVKLPDTPSSFKQSLLTLQPEDTLIATGIEGDFVLPEDLRQKIALIAGGIGITPFRSMIRHLLQTNESRDIFLLYSANTQEEFIFTETFREAENKSALRTSYITGTIHQDVLRKEIPDWQERLFYISGPPPMVQHTEKLLLAMGVAKNRIRRDYFPGYEEI